MLSGAMSYSEDDETFENYPRDTWHKIPIDDWKEISARPTVPSRRTSPGTCLPA